jgi:hypothetical protein
LSFVIASRVLSGTKYIEYVDEVEKKAKEEDNDYAKEEKEWRSLYAEIKSALLFERFHCILD